MIMDNASLQLNPTAMKPTDIAKLLTAASGQQVSTSMVQDAIDAGTPAAADGSINLVELIAWLEREYHENR